MATLPLLFRYGDHIAGHGFLVGVEVFGRALLEDDDDEAWVYGLNPGGLAGGGDTRREALADFRLRYTSVLFDIADLAETFDEFKREAELFFNEPDDDLEAQWNAAVQQVREGKLEPDWLRKHPFSRDDIRIRVVEVKRPQAEENVVPTEELAA